MKSNTASQSQILPAVLGLVVLALIVTVAFSSELVPHLADVLVQAIGWMVDTTVETILEKK